MHTYKSSYKMENYKNFIFLGESIYFWVDIISENVIIFLHDMYILQMYFF